MIHTRPHRFVHKAPPELHARVAREDEALNREQHIGDTLLNITGAIALVVLVVGVVAWLGIA